MHTYITIFMYVYPADYVGHCLLAFHGLIWVNNLNVIQAEPLISNVQLVNC